MLSGVFKEGARCDAPFGPTTKIFYRRLYMKRYIFLPFFQQELGEFAASIERSEAKSVTASGGLRPLDPRPGALPQDPRYRLALCALAMAPLCQIRNTPLHVLYI